MTRQAVDATKDTSQVQHLYNPHWNIFTGEMQLFALFVPFSSSAFQRWGELDGDIKLQYVKTEHVCSLGILQLYSHSGLEVAD